MNCARLDLGIEPARARNKRGDGAMTIEQIIVLAVVQGITEFLPISSSGHLILVPQIMHWQDQGINRRRHDASRHFACRAHLFLARRMAG